MKQIRNVLQLRCMPSKTALVQTAPIFLKSNGFPIMDVPFWCRISTSHVFRCRCTSDSMLCHCFLSKIQSQLTARRLPLYVQIIGPDEWGFMFHQASLQRTYSSIPQTSAGKTLHVGDIDRYHQVLRLHHRYSPHVPNHYPHLFPLLKSCHQID